MAKPKILLVTTDRECAKETMVTLAGKFDVTHLDNGEKALALLAKDSRFMVLLSGRDLPGMSGLELLTAAYKKHPQTIRLMVTEDRDFETAEAAINKAHVANLLSKPCPQELLLKTISNAVVSFKRERAEMEAMKDTLLGSVRTLVAILETTHPLAVRRSKRIRRRAQRICKDLKAMPPQMMDMIVLLSNIGCVGLPEGLLKKMEIGRNITKQDMKQFRTHPLIAARLLEGMPRMGKMAAAIRHQNTACSKNPPLGARILKVCVDIDQMELNGSAPDKAIEYMRSKPDIYDQKVVDSLAKHRDENGKTTDNPLNVTELQPGMIMQKDMVTEAGAILLHKGERLSEASHMRVQAFSDLLKIREPIHAHLPSA